MTERIEAFWQDATAEDVAGIANTLKPISARVRDEDDEAWREDLLAGWKLSKLAPCGKWIDADGVLWKQCQVYREPSWWLDKPDPGPGYRLLGKFPDEELESGDELWFRDDELWGVSNNAHHGMAQGPGCWYRRRIEPVEPEPKHYVLRVGYTAILPNGQTITITEKGFEVTQ